MPLLDAPPEESFDRLTRLVSRTLDVPIALLTAVDETRQFFKSSVGLPQPLAAARQTPLRHSICRHVVMSGQPLQVDDLRADPRFRDNPGVTALGARAYLGLPLRTSDGTVHGSLCAIDVRPRAWSPGDLQALGDLAAAAVAEVEWGLAREGELRFSALARAAPEGIVTMDAEGVIRTVNPAMEEIFGHTAAEIVGRPMGMLMPERFRADHARGLRRYLVTGERRLSWNAVELCGLTREGREVPLEISFGEYVHEGRRVFTGFVRDIRHRLRAQETLRRSEERFRSLVAATAQVVWTAGPDGVPRGEHAQWTELTGRDPRTWRGWGWLRAVHPADRAAAGAVWSEAVLARRPFTLECRFRRADGEYRLFSVRGVPVRDAEGDVREWVGMNVDVTERRREEEVHAFLAEASEALGSSIDYPTTLRTVARLAVPRMADWCTVDLLEEGAIRRVAVAHADPRKQRRADGLLRFTRALDAPGGAAQAIRTGQPLVYPDVRAARLEGVVEHSEERALLAEIGAGSALVVPLVARGVALGAITLVAAESGRRYGPADLPVALDLARRASLAVDHALLLHETEAARLHLEQQAQEMEHQLDELQTQAMLLEEGQAELEMSNAELMEAQRSLEAEVEERTRAEALVRASEQRLRAKIEASPIPTYLWRERGADLVLEEFNEAAVQVSGGAVEALRGAAARTLYAHENPRVLADLERCLAERRTIRRSDLFHTRAQGGARWLIATYAFVPPDSVMVHTEDITEMKRAEEALRTSEARYRSVWDGASEGLILVDRDPDGTFRYVDVNAAMERTAGEPRDRVIGRAPHQVLPPNEAERAAERFRRVFETGEPVEEEHVIHLPRGAVPTRTRVHPLKDEAGRVVRVLVTVEDVSARYEAEAAARESAARFRAVAELVPDLLWQGDESGAAEWYNRRWLEYSGQTAEEAAREGWIELIHPDDRDECMARYREALQTGRPLRMEHRIRGADGGYRWFLVQAQPVRGQDGRTQWFGAATDVHEQRLALEALRESERWVRTLFDHAPDGIGVHTLDGRIVDANARLCDMLGYTRAELLSMSVGDLEDAYDAPASGELWRQVEPGVPVSLTRSLRHREGGVVPIEASITRITLEGRPVILALVRDVTERVRLEEQLRQASKMEAVGRLSGGVAHDFNNMLQSILGNADLLLADTPRDSPARADLEEIRRSGRRAADLTRQLLAFSRQQVLAPRPLSLAESVVSIERMLGRMLGEDVELVTRLDPGAGRVTADPTQIEQVLLNLAVNARDAMPNGGVLTIDVHDVALSPADVRRRSLDLEPGRYVLLEVGDTGRGMDAATQGRVFEPFFTTKAVGQGTGLGLATVYGIVRQSGGTICVESAPEQGTRFVIYLPRLEADARADDEAAPRAAEPRAGTETVVVAEDEDAVRRLAARALRRHGYTVLEAANGHEALALLREHGGAVSLLLTDAVMPQMGGRELVETARAEFPALRVLFMSGYTSDAVVQRGVSEAELEFIQKPFAPDDLAARVRAVLDGA